MAYHCEVVIYQNNIDQVLNSSNDVIAMEQVLKEHDLTCYQLSIESICLSLSLSLSLISLSIYPTNMAKRSSNRTVVNTGTSIVTTITQRKRKSTDSSASSSSGALRSTSYILSGAQRRRVLKQILTSSGLPGIRVDRGAHDEFHIAADDFTLKVLGWAVGFLGKNNRTILLSHIQHAVDVCVREYHPEVYNQFASLRAADVEMKAYRLRVNQTQRKAKEKQIKIAASEITAQPQAQPQAITA